MLVRWLPHPAGRSFKQKRKQAEDLPPAFHVVFFSRKGMDWRDKRTVKEACEVR